MPESPWYCPLIRPTAPEQMHACLTLGLCVAIKRALRRAAESPPGNERDRFADLAESLELFLLDEERSISFDRPPA